MVFLNRIVHLFAGTRTSYPIYLGLVIYLICSIFFSHNSLPDYVSYKVMYNMRTGDFESFANGPFFVYLIKTANGFGFTYEQFRLLVRFVSVTLLITSIAIVDRKKYKTLSLDKSILNKVFWLVIVFSVLVFSFEFYSIRIRGGVSISLFTISFSLWYSSYVSKSIIYRLVINIVSILLLILSFNTHFSTATTLFVFLAIPLIFIQFGRLLLSSLDSEKTIKTMLAASYLLGIVSLVFIHYAALSRGDQLYSSINFYRMLSLSFFPILIATTAYYNLVKKIAINVSFLNFNSDARIKHHSSELLVCYFSIMYIGFALALFTLYVIGFITIEGEALVRIYTLSSVVSLMAIAISRSKYLSLWIFLIFVNSVFFVRTIFF